MYLCQRLFFNIITIFSYLARPYHFWSLGSNSELFMSASVFHYFSTHMKNKTQSRLLGPWTLHCSNTFTLLAYLTFYNIVCNDEVMLETLLSMYAM